jgi:hypothetical protein
MSLDGAKKIFDSIVVLFVVGQGLRIVVALESDFLRPNVERYIWIILSIGKEAP